MGPVQTVKSIVGKSELVNYLSRLERDRFYGELTLKIESGNIVHVRQDQVLKKDDLMKD